MNKKTEKSLLPEELFSNLEEVSCDVLLEKKFDKNLFKDLQSLEKLNQYLDINFVNYTKINDKNNLEKLSKIIVKSLGLLHRFYNTNESIIHDFINRWEHLSKLCSYLIEHNSYEASYEAIKNSDKLKKIIIYIYNEKSCIFSDIVDKFENSKQNMFHLISKLEKLGVINKKYIGKNVYITLSSIGLDIYTKNLKNNESKKEALQKNILLRFPDKKINEHYNIPVLELVS